MQIYTEGINRDSAKPLKMLNLLGRYEAWDKRKVNGNVWAG